MTRKEFYSDILQMDYFSDAYLQFEKDFYRFSALKTPLTFLVDDIMRMMANSQSHYFVLNGENATDHRDHYFYFEVQVDPANSRIRLFHYLRHSYQEEKKFRTLVSGEKKN